MRNKLKQINQEYNQLETNQIELNKVNETNINQLQTEIKKNSLLNKEIASLKSDNNKNIQEINQLGERLNTLRSANKDYEKSISILQSAMNNNTENTNSDKSKLNKLTAHIDHLQNKLKNVENNEASLISANKKLMELNEGSNKNTHQMLQDKDKLIQSLHVKLREKECVIKKLNSKKDPSELVSNLNS
jgi:chromosome segregation ATPase